MKATKEPFTNERATKDELETAVKKAADIMVYTELWTYVRITKRQALKMVDKLSDSMKFRIELTSSGILFINRNSFN